MRSMSALSDNFLCCLQVTSAPCQSIAVGGKKLESKTLGKVYGKIMHKNMACENGLLGG